ncbi:polysaccharide pyruvyl transferase WcaK-like protein [Microbacterium sp. AG1240]|uniref:polysaccharide pyruvyl transferase family protein n=1 Tax=Microbacterium sp. AG1240 TaxID=2183992 RepID=UPI000F0DACA1|nr:polysaccharide pyruvyl transferase family protein [Microbacterium sp. AG1240]RKT33363.1 polysaccharide pyruvyl transferase WcaK-like protein [Microbacterium sp. AG1240]
MSVIVIGDIGVVDGMMHIGDEAMFEAAAAELSTRGVDVVGVSSAPDESAARYGVGAVPRLGFAGLDRPAAAARSELLVAAASGRVALPAGDPATAVVEAVRASSGVLVAGGGNLASRWPVHIHERGTLAAMARSLGLPVVVSGQTLGPDLTETDAAAVRELLGTAALAAVREPTSAALAASWDVPVRLGVDDASFLGGDGARDRSGIVVSVSGWFDHRPPAEVEASIARLIDHAASVVGGPVRFHAHFGPLDADAEPRGDAALHERIRAHLTSPSEVVPTGDSRHSAALARSAALLITSRYHPAVFAAPAGVPTLGLVADAYTQIKLSGVLGHWGEPATATLDELDARARTLVERLDAARSRVRDEADARRPAHRAAYTAWWDDVAAVLAR